ncbi:hypothetical protein HNQ60_003920 [Povalibacter uvarum]|uniref:Helicase ATP-binding domain-containing protein n=1 Tax=Povalibacter uvarum TaxID=732238 RepID=A0A841HQK6_9GAMM|nr:DEAD/DEAH box helicase [Povalibacter uvarum]MBB6095033.1 hypothetical protein [Povalibacter uvarum]
MAFKKTPPPSSAPDSPDKLFLDLPRRKYTGLLDHQGQILRTYAKTGADHSDVALQLPTGSGKTLVGLLIAEWRRRKFRERTVYLCPTKQLVHQVVEEARAKYGLDTDGFTGRIRDYDPGAKARYTGGARVAVATYNSLFNTNPFFKDAHLIIVDDAHAAENYIGQLWTMRIERFSPEHAQIFAAVTGVLKGVVEPHFYSRLINEPRSLADKLWNDKLPTPDLIEIADDLREVIDEHIGDLDLQYPWRMISDHLEACQVYMSAAEILIRPLIPPTWSHEPFAQAKQRIFMSATLGAGGDLERLTGRRGIKRLAIPEGWDKQGIGRRFFIFPGMSLGEADARILSRKLMSKAGRSLVLVPSDAAAEAIEKDVKAELGFRTFSAADIEQTKQPFIDCDQAVAIVANRFDGIDFPGDSCRLLFIEGLPRAVNLQERFLMSRMGANLLLNERVQTRVLQAVGRCTRGLNDFSAVVVGGEELADYLGDRDRRSYMHPELQAELEFGIEQSQDVNARTLLENFSIFLEHEEAWEVVNEDILAKRDAAERAEFPAMSELERAVDHEISYQARMWQGDYEVAFDEAREVLGAIVHKDLKGYRALWHYLAGGAALLTAKQGVPGFENQARLQFSKAKEAARALPWLVTLSRYEATNAEEESRNAAVMRQIERVETSLMSLGKLHNRAYTRREKEIIDGLSSPKDFENAQKLLGELLGFSAGKVETDGSPDPWWLCDDIGFVFEDHVNTISPTPFIDTTKARQAASHADWMKENVPAAKNADVLPVLVTKARKAARGAFPSLKRVAYWPADEFRAWATQALAVLRELRTTFSESGDIDWRIKAAEAFEENAMDAPGLHARLSRQRASDRLEPLDAT